VNGFITAVYAIVADNNGAVIAGDVYATRRTLIDLFISEINLISVHIETLFFVSPNSVRDKSSPQYKEALRANERVRVSGLP